jgi:polyisoprenoid-binding protein YceI
MLKKLLVVAAVGSTLMFSFTLKEKEEEKNETPDEITEISESNGVEVFLLDAPKCKMEWTGTGVGKKHNGTINFQSGNLQVDTKQIKSGFFYVDMKSIKNNDIKDDGFNKQLVDHLKSEDFFNSNKFTTSNFKITKATRLDVPEGQINYTIVGDLTIKGVTKSIEFPALVTFSKKKITAKADFSIDRTKWNITYNSGNFFKDLGDKMIEDNIDFKVYLEANVK